MTSEQVKSTFPTYDLRWSPSIRGAAFLVSGEDIYASLSFCQNSLVSLNRDIDADSEFLTYVQEYLRQYGQPEVKVRKDAWTGTGGGDITTLEFMWAHGGVRYTLSFNPEGRTGAGELRYIRNASVGFFLENQPCSTHQTLKSH